MNAYAKIFTSINMHKSEHIYVYRVEGEKERAREMRRSNNRRADCPSMVIRGVPIIISFLQCYEKVLFSRRLGVTLFSHFDRCQDYKVGKGEGLVHRVV